MFERFARSWALVKASGSVLRQDKQLLVFPLISSIAMLAVVAAFVIPIVAANGFDHLSRRGGDLSLMHYATIFLFYVVQYFVGIFFNAALVGAALIRLDGGSPTLRDGLAIAGSRAWNILGYALIAATVGMVIRAIEERIGFIGRIIVGIIGIAWSLATFLVVPVLVARDVGPVEAIQDSARMLKGSWGENLIGQGGMGFAFALVYIAIFAAGATLIVGGAMSRSIAVATLAGVAMVAAILVTALIHSALSAIYSAALYRYANGEGGSGVFSAPLLASAFRPK